MNRVTVEFDVPRCAPRVSTPPAPAKVRDEPLGRTPRVSRLLALAIKFERLLQTGQVKDYATLARLGHVSRARITQIMNLLHLAPDLQEEILFLATIQKGRDRLRLRQLQPLCATLDWHQQRILWRRLPKA
jgi:hypothetical protein